MNIWKQTVLDWNKTNLKLNSLENKAETYNFINNLFVTFPLRVWLAFEKSWAFVWNVIAPTRGSLKPVHQAWELHLFGEQQEDSLIL